jgi:hypothetical protein
MIRRFRSVRCFIIVGMLLCAAAGCSKQSGADHGRPVMSERQRDSAIAKSSLPVSGVVGRALAASDSADARAGRIDSLTREPGETPANPF